MGILLREISISTQGMSDVIDLTSHVDSFAGEWESRNGQLMIFVPGSTAAVTTIESESGVINDLKKAIERLIPADISYDHDRKWGDGNGFSHVRAAWFGPTLILPVVKGKPALGTWQQIVIIDFDNRPRNRRIILQFTPESD